MPAGSAASTTTSFEGIEIVGVVSGASAHFILTAAIGGQLVNVVKRIVVLRAEQSVFTRCAVDRQRIDTMVRFG
jgi:hypothetical protein